MAEIVNLRRVRRQAERAAEAARAGEQRAKHGRTRAQREAEAKAAAVQRARVDGAKLAPEGEG